MLPSLAEHWFAWLLGSSLGIVWLSRIVAVAVNMRHIPDISRPEFDPQPRTAGTEPFVSIVVPARNEAEHIETALRSLLQLEYHEYEVIAVDDRSDDATGVILDWLAAEQAEVSSGTHLRVLHVSELPQGWLGKTHAMWLAAQQARGKWILFTDADVVFRGVSLRRAIVYAEQERADHLVVFPTMLMQSPGERMMMACFQSQFVFAHRPWKVADPKSRDSMGVGAFNLIRRGVYEKIGTYQHLRMAVLDDMKLGELVKQHGYRQRVAFGRDLLQLRWIVGTLGMVRNLTKNFFAILRFNPIFASLAIAGMLLVNVVPYAGAVLAPGWSKLGFGLALLSIFLVYLGMSWRSEISPLYFLLHPIGVSLMCLTLGRSMLLTLRHGGVVWRGTWYPLSELKEFSRSSTPWSWL